MSLEFRFPLINRARERATSHKFFRHRRPPVALRKSKKRSRDASRDIVVLTLIGRIVKNRSDGVLKVSPAFTEEMSRPQWLIELP